MSKDLAVLRWTIPNITQLPPRKRYNTDWKQVVNKHWWRLVVFPRGRPTHAEDLAVFLEVKDESSQDSWELKCSLEVTLLNHISTKNNLSKSTVHVFCRNQRDRGWDNFTDGHIKDVYEREGGYLEPSECKNIEIEVSLRFLPNQKAYVGIENQGATCYLNSLIQAFFHIPQLRREVYQIETTKDDTAKPTIALALQRLFYRLQTEETAVDTKELTKSFGWEKADVWAQNDVQELYQQLIQTLRDKLKGTASEGSLEKLLVGQVSNNVECLKVDFKSKRSDEFIDLNLNVKGCKTLVDSFKKYCESEILDGDNIYKTEEYGMQPAKKFANFESFPPILCLHLKRFEFNWNTNTLEKVNDKLQFPQTLDLQKFLSPTSKSSIKPVYQLYGVLVHSGVVSKGHYYAFLRPTKDPQWFKFDDTRVTKTTEGEAIDNNFGGADKSGYGKRSANAYMLIYLREHDRDSLLEPIKNTEIPRGLSERFERERTTIEAERRKLDEERNYITVNVCTEMHFYLHQGADLIDKDNLYSFKIRRDFMSITKLKEKIQQELSIPTAIQSLYTFARRCNKTLRPAFKGHYPSSFADATFFLDLLPVGPDGLPNTSLEKKVVIFIKLYQAQQLRCVYIGKIYVDKSTLLYDAFSEIKVLAGIKESSDIILYEEIKPERLDVVNPYDTIEDAKLDTGDILIVEERSFKENTPDALYFFSNFVNLETVTFKDIENVKVVPIKLLLKKQLTMREVKTSLANELGVDSTHLRFFDSLDNETLSKHLEGRELAVVNYEILSFPVEKLDTMMRLKLSYRDEKNTLYKKLVIYVLKAEATITNIVNAYFEKYTEVCSKTNTPSDIKFQLPEPKFRVLGIENGVIMKVFLPSTDMYKEYQPNKYALFIEETTEEEIPFFKKFETTPSLYPSIYGREVSFTSNKNKDQLVCCVFFEVDPFALHGEPFFFIFKQGETIQEAEIRMKQKLQIDPTQSPAWKFYKLVKKYYQFAKKRKFEESSCVCDSEFGNPNKITLLGIQYKPTPKNQNPQTTSKTTAPQSSKGIVFKELK